MKKIAKALWHWIKRILLAILTLILCLIIYALILEAIARRQYAAEYPSPGKMIEVGNHAIHLVCLGEGNPTVVFESDLDQYGILSWGPVQREIAKHTRACSYDRAGILWSEPGPRPRDGEMIARELAFVLETAGEEGPFLLVGHAFGGAYIRIFAGQKPNDVCGMVLVESSHPEMLTRFKEIGLTPEIPDKNIRPLIWLLSHTGSPGRFKSNPYNLSPEVNNPMQAFLPSSSMAWFDEKVASPTTLAQAGQYTSFGDMPIIVISSGTPITSIGAQGQAFQDLWIELQQELTLLSQNSEIRIYKTGHYPQLQDPELVSEAVLDVLEKCK